MSNSWKMVAVGGTVAALGAGAAVATSGDVRADALGPQVIGEHQPGPEVGAVWEIVFDELMEPNSVNNQSIYFVPCPPAQPCPPEQSCPPEAPCPPLTSTVSGNTIFVSLACPVAPWPAGTLHITTHVLDIQLRPLPREWCSYHPR